MSKCLWVYDITMKLLNEYGGATLTQKPESSVHKYVPYIVCNMTVNNFIELRIPLPFIVQNLNQCLPVAQLKSLNHVVP